MSLLTLTLSTPCPKNEDKNNVTRDGVSTAELRVSASCCLALCLLLFLEDKEEEEEEDELMEMMSKGGTHTTIDNPPPLWMLHRD